MSAFICGNQHFNSIESKLFDLIKNDQDFYFPYSLRDKFPVLYDNKHNLDELILIELGAVIDTLRNLNVVTVTLKYAAHYEGKLDAEIKEQKAILFEDKKNYTNLTKRGLYNALRCLSYQIETEHLDELGGMEEDERKAMFFLNEMVNALAHHILINLPSAESDNTWEVEG
jgi:hypothetical protein